MEKEKIIKGLKEKGLNFIYSNFHKLEESQKRELLISSLYILTNNGLLYNENNYKNTLIDELNNIDF